jgi:Flp pilus assembly protein TadD
MKRDLRRDVQNIQAQLMQGRFDAGIKLCREVLAYAPREPNTLYMLGVAAAQIGDAVTTREAFSQALTVTPDRIDLLLNFGNFLRETMRERRRCLFISEPSPLPHKCLRHGKHWR